MNQTPFSSLRGAQRRSNLVEGYEIATPHEVGATTKVWRRWEFIGEILGIALVSVLVGAMPGDKGLTARR